MSKKKDGSTGGMTLTLVSVGVPLLMRKVAAIIWTKVVGKKPPIDLTDPQVTLAEALGWSVAMAIIVETARFGITRSAAKRRSELEATGTEDS